MTGDSARLFDMKRDLQEALGALARAEGKTEDQLLAELLKGRVAAAERTGSELVRRGPSPVARVASSVERQSDAEALERWMEAEQAPTGVFGAGGMTAGGIFGEVPVATEGFDAPGYGRALAELAQMRGMHPGHYPGPAPMYQEPAPPPPAQMVRFVRYEGPTVTVFEGPMHAAGMLPPRRR